MLLITCDMREVPTYLNSSMLEYQLPLTVKPFYGFWKKSAKTVILMHIENWNRYDEEWVAKQRSIAVSNNYVIPIKFIS